MARAHVYTGRAAIPFLLAIAAAGVFLSHPILGRLWHPPAGSPFAAATPDQFHRVFVSRFPNGSILAYRVVGAAGLALTRTGPNLSLWEAQVREAGGNAAEGPVVLSRPISGLGPSSPHMPVAISQLTEPAALVAYVSDPSVWAQEGSVVIRWSNGQVSRLALAGRPRAWILPPPAQAHAGTGTSAHVSWQYVEIFRPLGQPLVTLTPQGAVWAPRPLSLPAGLYSMPGQGGW